jgi:hypothetical protein
VTAAEGDETDQLLAFFSRELSWPDRAILRWRGSRWEKALPRLKLRDKVFIGTTSAVIERVVRDLRSDPTLSSYNLEELGVEFTQMCRMRYFVRPHIALAFFSLSLLYHDRPRDATAQNFIDLYRLITGLWTKKLQHT